MGLNWDDLRFVLAVFRAGSLAKAGRTLSVEHTTVARRLAASEEALGVPLFVRTPTGYVPTAALEELVPRLLAVEHAVLDLERSAVPLDTSLEGVVRIAAPETFGAYYLSPRLAAFGQSHPGITLELVTGGDVLDLSRREADIAVRPFRTDYDSVVSRRVGEVTYGLYATDAYLAAHPVSAPIDLRGHRVLSCCAEPSSVEAEWVKTLLHGGAPAFLANFTASLLQAALAGAGIAVLPRYLGAAEPRLVYLPATGEPKEALWITVHRDVKETPRIRATMEFLVQAMEADAALLSPPEASRA